MNSLNQIPQQNPEGYGPKKPKILDVAKNSDYFKFKDKVIVTESGAYINKFPKLPLDTGMECTYCGCVSLILKSLDENVTYEQLMGLTASCYRANMHYGWNPASNILDLTNYFLGTNITDIALSCFGWECYQPENADIRDTAVMNSINTGIPVLILGGRYAPEWSILLGYERNDTGIKFFGRSYFDKNAPEDECFTENKYTFADKYPGERNPFLLRKIVNQTYTSPLKALKKSLETCILMFQPHEKIGYDAYNYMIESFRSNVFLSSWGSEGKIDTQIPVLADARRAASIYLKDSSELLTGENANKLKNVSHIYTELSEILNDISDHSDNYNLKTIRNNEKMRKYIVQKLEDCIVLEKNAHELIGAILNDWNK